MPSLGVGDPQRFRPSLLAEWLSDLIEQKLFYAVGNRMEALRTRLWTTPSLFLLLLGGWGLFFLAGFLQLPTAMRSLSWPAIEGVILSSEIHEECCGEYTEGWWPEVSYGYSISGTEYVSDKVEIVDVGDSNTAYFARQVILRYPVGNQVMVYYNPAEPRMAVLEPGIPDNHYMFFLILAMIDLAAILLLLGLLGVLGVVKLPSGPQTSRNLGRWANH